MSNRDGFGSGFWLGTLVGGVVGGIVGASLVSQRANRLDDETESGKLGEGSAKRPLKSSRRRTLDRVEVARQSLDDKINDLNHAIDSVRSSLGHVGPEDSIEELIKRADEDLNTQQSKGFPAPGGTDA